MATVKELIAELGPWPGTYLSSSQRDYEKWSEGENKIKETVAGQAYFSAGKAVSEVENKLRHAKLELYKATQVVENLERSLQIAKHVETALLNVEVA